MAYKYTVNLGSEEIDLDEIVSLLSGDYECQCDAPGQMLRREMMYQFGKAGCKFIIDTISEKVNAIKAENANG